MAIADVARQQRPRYLSASGMGRLGQSYRFCATIFSGFLATALLVAFLVGVAAWLTDFFIRDGWLMVLRSAAPFAAVFVVLLILVYCVLYLHVRVIAALALLFGAAYCVNAPWTIYQLYRLGFYNLNPDRDPNTAFALIAVTSLLLVGLPLWLTFVSFGIRALVSPTRQLRAARLPPPDPRSIGSIIVHALGVPPAIRRNSAAGIITFPALSRIAFGFVALSVFSAIIYIPNTYFTYIVVPCVQETSAAERRLLDDTSNYGEDQQRLSAYLHFDSQTHFVQCFDRSRPERERISRRIIISAAAAFLLALPLLPLSWAFYRAFRRRVVRSLEESNARDGRRPVLYLRSFDLDRSQFEDALSPGVGALFSPADSPRDFDELLKLYAEVVGPVIGLGAPNERQQRFGVARGFPSEDEWKSVVATEADRAALIVMVLAKSKGVEWEIGHLTDKDYWTKTLCYFGTEFSWRDASDFLIEKFGVTTKKRGKFPVAFGFDRDGRLDVYFGSDRHFATLHGILVDHINVKFGRGRWLEESAGADV